ncbi:MAG: excinuclease ABC subunit UvrA, partial [Puniceicoccales bacterium]|nr:excinuclease ABC subunit UvrA [Puniceicoccales bacterium]
MARKAGKKNIPDTNSIRIRGARQNNLQGFDLDIPVGKLVVVTGLSGAGKSSLVFDTLHAEGQRRYVETFSPYTRQFLELLPAPQVDAVENIRPSIAIQQGNTIKTSRSTVGTMTELCDWFKVWFAHRAELIDPNTGTPIRSHHPASVWDTLSQQHSGETVLLAFSVSCPGKLKWSEALAPFIAQGYTRGIFNGTVASLETVGDAKADGFIIQDRITLTAENKDRFIEAATRAFSLGQGRIHIFDAKEKSFPNARSSAGGKGKQLQYIFSEALISKAGRRFRPAIPALFSFNSPVGACPSCRGFGRVIGLDWAKVIPDENKSILEGAIAAFQGQIYSESQRDLLKRAEKCGVPVDIPFKKLSKKDRDFVIEGEPGYGVDGKKWPKAWYGVKEFFTWLESNAYKMHVRVFLSRYRSYSTCSSCGGQRLQPEALCWQWQGNTLSQLYEMPVSALLARLLPHRTINSRHPADQALEAIIARLTYLEDVGLGYLTLNRQSRTLSGGEVQRVNLTACLGAALADALFVLDEPSIGLHPRDLGRMVGILRRLVGQGNTVVVVEHDESVMRAANHLIEIGPKPGRHGGQLVFSGDASGIVSAKDSATGPWLSGKKKPSASLARKIDAKTKRLRLSNIHANNLRGLSLEIPLKRFVGLCGVSGSGKSTLLNQVLAYCGESVSKKDSDDGTDTRFSAKSDLSLGEVALVDQSPVSRTPRSNAALYTGAWDTIRKRFADTPEAGESALTPSHFSFNSGDGRCPNCNGSGWETVEMQFLADVHVPCPVCEGKRFRPEILEFKYHGKSVADILSMTVDETLEFFAEDAVIVRALSLLKDVGLGYLTLGQPLNTLSGGEAQRLKLVRFMGSVDQGKHTLILLDEPTTGLHREDVSRLLAVLQRLVEAGHSLVVVEHHTDVLNAADWLIELGPDAGDAGGQVVASAPPAEVAKGKTATAPFLGQSGSGKIPKAETKALVSKPSSEGLISLRGAREHNLRNLDVDIPHNTFSVVTGVSGSGKSSLAFDILFAEGQRRFLECMSAYARQFVEQLPRPELDSLSGLPPTVAIEQRVTRGGAKSTVSTVTEVAQYLRLLYAKIGVPHNPATGNALATATPAMLRDRIQKTITSRKKTLLLCSPVVRDRKGHHQPLANWAKDHGFSAMRIDGKMVPLAKFKPLDRYKTHDIELVVAELSPKTPLDMKVLSEAIRLGKGTCLLCDPNGKTVEWLSTERTDPETGESFPVLEPKNFSWNSPQGWCSACHGHGRVVERFAEEMGVPHAMPSLDKISDTVCPVCNGSRLNPVSRAVLLKSTGFPNEGKKEKQSGKWHSFSLPQLLALPPQAVMETLTKLELDKRGAAIAASILPEIHARLQFLDHVGLGYLALDRSADTLSGGEAQRIRLAAQLGSNLAGALYVLDEPSIGLHPQDNERLIGSLHDLRDRGNTVLVVEHDEETMRAADLVIDLGPGAGIHGGNLIGSGSVAEIAKHKDSLTARYLRQAIPHPLRGAWRELPKPARKSGKAAGWLELKNVSLRNLKGADVQIPLERLSVVCGVSGAGKSTLVRDLLVPSVSYAIKKKADKISGKQLIAGDVFPVGTFPLAELRGATELKQVILVDQDPIGKTPRSTPATYIGAYDRIRKHFANLPEAKMRGYSASFFSFNTAGGRCETCSGAGRVKLEMNFLPDTYVPCDDCGGSRYGPAVEEIRWNERNIGDVLAMSFEEAAEFFTFDKHLKALLELMVQTGLGYLTLGQSSPTLSGGEAQR